MTDLTIGPDTDRMTDLTIGLDTGRITGRIDQIRILPLWICSKYYYIMKCISGAADTIAANAIGKKISI